MLRPLVRMLVPAVLALAFLLPGVSHADRRYFLQSYTPVKRGNLGRTPSTATLDLHADYPLHFEKSQLSLMFDVFNVMNSQKATGFDDNVEITAGVTDPDYGKTTAYQLPRSLRLAARWSF